MALKKSEIYSSLWSSCDALRGGMDASQYKDYVLVLLFIKYVSDKYSGQPYPQRQDRASIPSKRRFRQVRRAEPADPVNSVKTRTLQAVRPAAAECASRTVRALATLHQSKITPGDIGVSGEISCPNLRFAEDHKSSVLISRWRLDFSIVLWHVMSDCELQPNFSELHMILL